MGNLQRALGYTCRMEVTRGAHVAGRRRQGLSGSGPLPSISRCIVNNRISETPLTSPSISPYWPPPSTVLLAFKWACTPLPHVWTRPTVPLTALPSEVYPLDSFTSLNSDLLKETHLINLQFNTETCSPYFPPP